MSIEQSIQAQWPDPRESLAVHTKSMQQGIEAIQDSLILPEDQRFETAYALLLSGRGQKSSVLAMGEPASGKTSFGDILFGVQDRVEISRDHTEDVLYGYPNPIKPAETVPGKLVGLRANNPTAYLNEVSHLPNTGPLHRLWDAESLEANGKQVNIRDIAIYATSNFPDGNARVHELDEAFRSRITMEMLTGDHNSETARKIQGYNAVKNKESVLYPILPTSAVRRSIAEQVAERYPARARDGKIGGYIVQLIEDLNEGGLVLPINTGDARIGEALHDTARARMFLNEVRGERGEATSITARNIAEIAALVLPTIAVLSYTGSNRLKDATGRRTSKMEQAVAVRRVIARAAFTTLFDSEIVPGKPTLLDRAVDKYSYANPEALTFDVDQALFGSMGKVIQMQSKDSNEKSHKRRFGRSAR